MDSYFDLQNKIQYHNASLMDKHSPCGKLSVGCWNVIYMSPDDIAKWIMMVINIVMIVIRQLHDRWAQEKPVVCEGVP